MHVPDFAFHTSTMATAAGAEAHIPMPSATQKEEQKMNHHSAEILPSTTEHKQATKICTAEFMWPWGGDKVAVAGSWNNWTPVPMIYDRISCTYRIWVPNVPRGRISYKFIMDGEWRYDGQKPITRDEFGNVNNVIEL